MNQLSRMLLAGMLLAAMATSHARAGVGGTMTAVAVFAATSGVAPAPAVVNGHAITGPATSPRIRERAFPTLTEPQLMQIRAWVSSELSKLGRDRSFAGEAALMLTPEDLAVLAANPKMMQPAGAMSAQFENFLWAALIIGGIVALVIAADSSSVIIRA